jgi:hypothetical protein
MDSNTKAMIPRAINWRVMKKEWTSKMINLSRNPRRTRLTFPNCVPNVLDSSQLWGGRSHDGAGAGLVEAAAVAALAAAARLGDGLEGLDGIHFLKRSESSPMT